MIFFLYSLSDGLQRPHLKTLQAAAHLLHFLGRIFQTTPIGRLRQR
jgi:hypothetical protein